jgi:hypothetical protein
MMGPAEFPVDFPDSAPTDILVDHDGEEVVITVVDDDGTHHSARVHQYLAYQLGSHICRAAGKAEFGGENDE